MLEDVLISKCMQWEDLHYILYLFFSVATQFRVGCTTPTKLNTHGQQKVILVTHVGKRTVLIDEGKCFSKTTITHTGVKYTKCTLLFWILKEGIYKQLIRILEGSNILIAKEKIQTTQIKLTIYPRGGLDFFQ